MKRYRPITTVHPPLGNDLKGLPGVMTEEESLTRAQLMLWRRLALVSLSGLVGAIAGLLW